MHPIHPGRASRRLALGTLLSPTGRTLALFGAAIALASPLLRLAHLALAWTPSFWLGILVVVVGLRIQLYGKRLRSRTGEEILAEDMRNPVVYLRPFAADAESTEYGQFRLFSGFFSEMLGTKSSKYPRIPKPFLAIPSLLRLVITPPLTEEEQLAMAVKNLGPVVAVASPGETLPPAGIPRLSFAASDWHEQVSALLKSAKLIIIRCGVSRQSTDSDGCWPVQRAVLGGFRWELDLVVARVQPEKLVLLLPFDELEYETFCSNVEGVFPCKLPRYFTARSKNPRALLWFDASWNPFLAPITWLDNSLRLDTRYPLVASLRNKFEAVTGGTFDLHYGGSNQGRRILALLIDLLIVGGITPFLAPILFAVGRFTSATFVIAQIAIVPVAACAYFACFEGSCLMATSGKRLLGLMVVDINGHRLSLSNAFRRAATKVLLLPVTWIPAVFAGDKRALHDRWSKSMVALGALRVSEPPRRWFVLLSGAVTVVSIITWTAIGWTVIDRTLSTFR